MNNIKIGVKLISGFVIVALIAAVIGIIGTTKMKTIADADTMLYEQITVALAEIGTIAMSFHQVRVYLRDMVRSNDPEIIRQRGVRVDELSAIISKNAELFEKTLYTENDKKLFQDFQDARTEFRKDLDEIKRLATENKDAEAWALIDGHAAQSAQAEQAAIDRMSEAKVTSGKQVAADNTATYISARNLLYTFIALGILIALFIGIFLTLSITGPLQKGVTMMLEMAKGHLGNRLKTDRKDEIGILAKAMDDFSDDLQNNIVATVKKIGDGDLSADLKPKDGQDEITPAIMSTTTALRGLVAEAGMLRKAAVEGKLATRGQADKFKGGYKDIVQGVNETLDSVIAPLNVAAEYVDRISKGDVPQKITDNYNGDFNEIKNNLNQCIDAIHLLVSDANILSSAAISGKLATRADASKHQGDFKKIVEGVNETLDSVIGPLNVAAEYVDRISKGDIPQKITDNYNGDFNEIKNNLNKCIDAVNNLVADANMLSKAAVDGKLATRADASKHQGDFQKIVQGVNETLDAVIAPLNVAAEYVDRISKGDIPPKITDTYHGDFNEIKNNLNQCIEALSTLINQMKHMADEHNRGDIDVQIATDKFEGVYKTMAQGINDMVNGHITVKKKAMACVAEFGKGNFDAPLEKFPGKKAFINETIEMVRSNIKEFIAQMKNMSHQHDLGDIDVIMNINDFEGAYKEMADGVNKMANGHIAVKKKAMACVAEFGKGNFDAPLEKFPGKKAFINETIEAVRTNLKNIAKELRTLIDASKNGALTTRGNAAAYLGDWQTMIQGVNEILDAILMPINEAASVLEKVAARDMTARVAGDYKGDHTKIKNSLNSAVDNLDKALQQVTEATEQVSSASIQISSGSQSLAQGANEQASSLEEVSSSLEEMASMTKQNADNANQAKGLSSEADGNAKTGTEAMNRMSGAINRIKESSDQTAKIVKTIDEIAMQTNLLALNAAVEAARAGEAGRGFAVVAEEVRNLAQRSAQAAKNTADMITESVKNADDGVKIAVEVSTSFETIATSAKKVNDLIAEIAAASQEQSSGIEQINTAVAQMDKVTQQNAANSEESASAAEQLSSQSEELKGMVSQFMLSHSGSSIAAAVRKPVTSQSVVQTLPREKNLKSIGKKVSGKTTTIKPEDVIPMDDISLKEF